MRQTLIVSILINLALAGILYYQRPAAHLAPPPPAIAPAPVVTQVAPEVAEEQPRPFHWSQLLAADDYRTYVANLRSAGCPEPTIRDIVSGDTERAFFEKRKQLNLDRGGTGPWSQMAENQLTAFLLGELDPAANTVNNGAAVTCPLVLQQVDVDALKLNADQLKTIDRIRQQFIDEIGGTDQDPNDPAYLKRWQKAQPKVDASLRGWLGAKAFTAYGLAARNAQAATENP